MFNVLTPFTKMSFFFMLICTAMNFWLSIHATQMQSLVSAKNYSIDLRPLYGERPLEVGNVIIVTTLGPIDEKDMTFEISYIYRQTWNDPRLASNKGEITSSISPRDTIWIPDVYIVNARHVDYFGHSRTIIQQNGDVFYSQKVSAKCSCHMDLARYPMDEQICNLRLESWAFNTNHLTLKWIRGGHNHKLDKKKIALTGYKLLQISQSSEVVSYGENDTFTNLFVHFNVRRTSVYYVYKAFLPTIFLSIFNIGSYYIPDDALPARVTLIITTFLANTFILQSVSDQTIKVSYTTAMQMFLLVNLLFLMSSVLQYLLLLFLRKRSSEKQGKIDEKKKVENSRAMNMEEKLQSNGVNSDDSNGNYVPDFSRHLLIMENALISSKRDNVHFLDRIFRSLMPFLYLLFCGIYFGYYLN